MLMIDPREGPGWVLPTHEPVPYYLGPCSQGLSRLGGSSQIRLDFRRNMGQ